MLCLVECVCVVRQSTGAKCPDLAAQTVNPLVQDTTPGVGAAN